MLLKSLGAGDAVIAIGERNYRVQLADLSQYWFGEYLLLWRPQIDEVKSFFPGMTDPDVNWLRESLAAIQGKPIEPVDSRGANFFDAELEARVRDYQIDRRLTVDGAVGQQTQIVMNSDLDIGAPRLLTPQLVRAN